MNTLIGMDVGGTNLRIGVIECGSEHLSEEVAQPGLQPKKPPKLLEEMRFQADFSNLCKTYVNQPEVAWQHILATMVTSIQTVRAKYPKISAVGIGFPGFIEPLTQKIVQSPNLPGLSRVDLSAALSEQLSLPVFTENDALAAAYGEFIHVKADANLIYLGLGTGVGGGLIINRQPYQGHHGVAMEVGHIIVSPHGRLCGCGNRGCMEQYASATGVSTTYFEATQQQHFASDIAIKATQGDQAAIAAYALAGESLAKALAHILKVVDVRDVVIGGGMSGAWHLMCAAFDQQLNQDLIPVLRNKVNVRLSTMGDQAGMIGAALLGLENVSTNKR